MFSLPWIFMLFSFSIRWIRLRRLRRVFDRDGNGYITRDELQIAMEMMQENVTETQVNEMLQLADLDKDGKINYEGNKNHTPKMPKMKRIFCADLRVPRNQSSYFCNEYQ